MLEPAICNQEILRRKFSKLLYTDEYYYYTGYIHASTLPTFEAEDNHYDYAVVFDYNVSGYFSYQIDPSTDTVYNFGLMSFNGNPQVLHECYLKFQELVENHRRIEWRMIGGNPIKPLYDKLIQKYKDKYYTNILEFKDVLKDKKGEYQNSYIYEIVKKGGKQQ